MKLGNLLKKELGELLTKQAIFSMIFTCLLLIVIGQFMGGVMDEAISNSTVNIADLDGSEFTQEMIKALPEYGADPVAVSIESDDYFAELKRLELENAVIIPKGFGEAVLNGEQPELKCVSLIDKGGLASSMSSMSSASLTGSVTDYVSDYIQKNMLDLSDEQMMQAAQPVVLVDYTAANGKTVEASAESLSAMLMTQSMIAPFAVFFLILMASQMIMTAISTEKIDKTLETLMSAPVSRITVLTAKMIAALIVALLNAGAMMIGFAFYMQGMMGGAVEEITASADSAVTPAEAMASLGMSLSGGEMVIFGVQLFLTIAIGLSISLILGAMATDTKSVQTLVLPVMMLTMIPFFATMFADVNSMSTLPKIILYIIPFTHTYTAMNNMIFGHMGVVWAGLAYQLVFFAVCMYLAVKIFTTDLLFTMSLPVAGAKKKGAVKASGADAK